MDEIKIKDSDIVEINKKLLESLENYRKFMSYASGDLPLECLCLPKPTEKILLDNGFLRIYDLFDADLTKVKGLGQVRLRDLTTRLDKFLAMS
jgi:hypothetical protein